MANAPNHHEVLTSVQAGRAVAALLVIFYHVGLYIFALDKYWGYDPANHFFDFGHAGVQFFFVLSGFIILYIHRKDLDKPGRFFSYATKRFLRIYPIYWIILTAVIAVYFMVPSYGFPYHRDVGTILSSILLIHINGNSDTELAVAWTLYHEILFYCFFSLAILNQRFGQAVMGLWILACAATLMIKPSSYSIEFLFSPLQLLFSMGMLSCWLLHHVRIPSPRPLALAGIALFIAAGMEEDYIFWLDDIYRDLIYGFASALILVGIVAMERQGRLKIPSAVTLVGNASYVIYLINFTVLSFLAKLFIFMGARETLPAWISYLLLVALSVLMGIAVHLFIERPLLATLQRYRKHTMTPETAYSYTGGQKHRPITIC